VGQLPSIGRDNSKFLVAIVAALALLMNRRTEMICSH
jgi:hypothetical protein